MQCMKCEEVMQKTIYEGVLVDYCSGCHSFWLDGGEFERILKGQKWDVERAFADSEREKAIEAKKKQDFANCPRCGEGEMHPYKRNNVRVEQCDKCDGLFFDDGELEAIYLVEKMTAFKRIWEHVKSLL